MATYFFTPLEESSHDEAFTGAGSDRAIHARLRGPTRPHRTVHRHNGRPGSAGLTGQPGRQRRPGAAARRRADLI